MVLQKGILPGQGLCIPLREATSVGAIPGHPGGRTRYRRLGRRVQMAPAGASGLVGSLEIEPAEEGGPEGT